MLFIAAGFLFGGVGKGPLLALCCGCVCGRGFAVGLSTTPAMLGGGGCLAIAGFNPPIVRGAGTPPGGALFNKFIFSASYRKLLVHSCAVNICCVQV